MRNLKALLTSQEETKRTHNLQPRRATKRKFWEACVSALLEEVNVLVIA